MKRFLAQGAVLFCVVACAIVAVAQVWPTAQDVRADDRNADGRPDIWRHYDDRGQLVKITLDSNWDGRSDTAEYYDHGVLLRRESDRDFNGQVDLVEEFDPTTHEHVRSVVDIDFDGTADLLVLFQDGQPVFSKQTNRLAAQRATPATSLAGRDALRIRYDAADGLAPLTDPFRSDTNIRRTLVPSSSDGCIGLSTSGGLPSPCFEVARSTTARRRLVPPSDFNLTPTALLPRSPRGPPLS